MKQKLLVIVGPTAVGKTELSIEFAKRLNAEIISGDSMQIYKGLDIGTAKITLEEMNGVAHYLIDCYEPNESYSASQFQDDATRAIEKIVSKGKLPIVVGGTGLYIEGLLQDMHFGGVGSDNLAIREALQLAFEMHGIAPLYAKLQQHDPKAAEKISPTNPRRVIRALEVIEQTGQLFSQQETTDKYDALVIALTCDREILYSRINQRVDSMIDQGLLEETQWLLSLGLDEQATSMKAIGYKELFPYFRGELDLQTCVDRLKQNSRRYAKRQLTWFRNRMTVRWFDIFEDNKEDLMKEVESWLNVSF